MARKYAFTRGRYQRNPLTNEIERVTKSGEFYKKRTHSGKSRRVLEYRGSAKTNAQLKIGKLLKSGHFEKLPRSKDDGVNLKNSVIAMAKTVGANDSMMHKIQRMNRDKLHALMTADQIMIKVVFDYHGYDYESDSFINDEGIENIEFLISRYEKTFGVIR